VFPRKEVPFWVRTVGDHIWGKYALKTPKMGVNRQFQAKTAKYKNRNISTRNSSEDEMANVNFLYDDIVHTVKIQ